MSGKQIPSNSMKGSGKAGGASAQSAMNRKSISGNITSPSSAGFLAAISPQSSASKAAGGSGGPKASSYVPAVDSTRYDAGLSDSDDDAEFGGRTVSDKRLAPSVMGFGRRRDQETLPSDIPELIDDVKVDVYVRYVRGVNSVSC